MPTAEYTYRFKDDDNRLILTEIDVEFDYTFDQEDGACITAIRIEGDVNMLSQAGWRKMMALDIAEQITGDYDYIARLTPDHEEYRQYRMHRAVVDSLRTFGRV